MRVLRSTTVAAVFTIAAATMATAPPAQAATLEVRQVRVTPSVTLEIKDTAVAASIDTSVVQLTQAATSAIEILPARGGGTVSDSGSMPALAPSTSRHGRASANSVPIVTSTGRCRNRNRVELAVTSLRTTPLRV